MNTKLAITIAKYVGSVAIATTIACIANPAIKNFFGLKKKEQPEVIPSEDIDEEEISED